MIRRPPRSTQSRSSAASDVYKRQHHSLNMPLQPATYQQVVRNGLRVTSRFDLPPGRYQLRIAAVEANARRTGSVYYDLVVPDFTAAPLTMSGLCLLYTSPSPRD